MISPRRLGALCAAFLASVSLAVGSSALPNRPRLVVLTDYFQDPDDLQSMIRLLLYANEFEIEGLIATSLSDGKGSVRPELLHDVIDAYAKVAPNLQSHARPGFPYPEPQGLKSLVKAGAPVIRRWLRSGQGFNVPYPEGGLDSRTCDPAEKWIGAGKDTEASEHLVSLLVRDDSRPLWVVAWGGPMDLAQALWRVRESHSPERVRQITGRLRYYQVSWQDTGAVWLWDNFPDVLRVQSQLVPRGFYQGGPSNLRDEAWLRAHVVEGHGPLGALYPKAGANGRHALQVKEGDTPSFLYLLAPGLGDPDRPEWGGWGGRFRRLDDASARFVDARDIHPSSREPSAEGGWTVARWSEAIANDFAARMDWCMRPPTEANHSPVAHVDGDPSRRVLLRTVRAGEAVSLDARGSSDPDRDPLAFRWWHYREPGTFGGELRLEGQDSPVVRVVAPQVSLPATAHLVLEVTDGGNPRLTSYRRVVLTVIPN